MSENSNEGGCRQQCLESLIEVFLYLDGQLNEEKSKEISLHLENCARCYGRIEFEQILQSYLKTKVGFEEAAPEMVARVNAILGKR